MATARLIVDGRRLVTGDAFEAFEREAADLCALGFARRERKPVVAPVAPAPIAAKVVTASGSDAAKETTSTARGRYARRDLRVTP